ncbi:MAG: DUF5615 family PIN-like protein [Bacteroidales bacterium]|nr:DUF5615 family PIN-like protein [Bacteroidales bacterium]MCF8458235.1 DUF5615 family PIN-like protein [Bacteroidales bacterium]
MKFLFDENISYRAVKKLSHVFPESSHVEFLNLMETNDRKIWEYAKEEGYSIITQDADFNEFSLIWGFPPKVIWIRIGNSSTNHIVALILENQAQIRDFIMDKENGILIFE